MHVLSVKDTDGNIRRMWNAVSLTAFEGRFVTVPFMTDSQWWPVVIFSLLLRLQRASCAPPANSSFSDSKCQTKAYKVYVRAYGQVKGNRNL